MKFSQNTEDGKLSDFNWGGVDMGNMCLYCYYWDSSKQKYIKQLLRQKRDHELFNITTEAYDLVKYIDQLLD